MVPVLYWSERTDCSAAVTAASAPSPGARESSTLQIVLHLLKAVSTVCRYVATVPVASASRVDLGAGQEKETLRRAAHPTTSNGLDT